MKKFLIVWILISALSLFAQDQSASFGLTAEVKDTGNAQWESQVRKDAILKNLQVLEDNYLSQLPKRQLLEASMLVEEIREILNGKITEENTSVTTQMSTTESSQSLNINMNFSGFDTTTQIDEPATEANPEPVVQAAPDREPMNSSAFNQLVSNIKSEAFAEDQIRYVRLAANSHYFSVNQIGILIDLFDFAEEKLQCLQITFPRVTDKDNSYNIIGHFTYEDDKASAETIISQ